LKILIVHNRYQQHGGEDFVVENENQLLLSRGNDVRLMEVNNDHIHGLPAQISASVESIHSVKSKRAMAGAIADFCPDIVHVHNLFPTLSPSILEACTEAGVAMVRTIHNFRLICPSGVLFRDGKVCELCVGKSFAWPGVIHACYRGSNLGTLAVALSTLKDRGRMKKNRWPNHYIGLTNFGVEKLIEGCLPNAVYHVKPNFLFQDPGVGGGDGGYFIFVARLVPEKGIETLLRAWEKDCAHLKLKVAGSGSLMELVAKASQKNPNIECLGHTSQADTEMLIKGALAMICPSEWYEGFPMSILQALAMGTPVVASKIGSMAQTIVHEQNGLHFTPGDAVSLSEQVLRIADHHDLARVLRVGARRDYELNYTAEINYRTLMGIYERVIASYDARPLPTQSG
jgi:glycosyltransferase involved in cell wall biosynthesis